MISITHATAQGNRRHQEDRVIVAQVPDGKLLAIADGHGGDAVAEYINQNLLRTWLQCSDQETDGDTLVNKVFAALHQDTKHMRSGSTLSLAFIEEPGAAAAIAVLGDSPVIINDKTMLWLSPEHNVRNNLEERSQAIQRGGFYSEDYIWKTGARGLQMSRALGDVDLDGVLNREPEIHIFMLDKPAWILVASDGLIDPSHMATGKSYTDITELINNGAEAKTLVDRAVKLQTNDNASAIVWRNK